MATVIVMPRLSPTMEEGVLAKWTKNEGDKIVPGDIIAEVETDKANMDFPLEDEGVLLKQLAAAGETVRLGAPVGILGDKGEDFSALLAEISGGKAGGEAKAAPAKDAAAKDAPAEEADAAEQDAAPAEEGADEAPAEEAAADDESAEDEGADTEAPATAGKGKAAPKTAAQTKAAPGAAAADAAKTKAAPEKSAPAADAGKAKPAPAADAGQAKAADDRATGNVASAPKAAAQVAAGKGGPMPPPPGAPVSERQVASPLARRMAGDAGLDIRNVAGSGPGGRVIKRDIAKALLEQIPAPPAPLGSAVPAKGEAPAKSEAPAKGEAPAKAAAPAKAEAPAAPAAVPSAFPGDETVPLSMMRRAVAKRLTESKQTVPHFYLTSEAAVDALWNFREDLNRAAVAAGGEKVSVNDFILKALARALRVVPAANMSFGADGVSAIRHQRVDISVAVAMDDGLITPVVRHADTKSLGTLAKEVKELAARGRDKRLRPEEYTGGTFSLTNLGMFGIREFYAIVNPPESGILAVGQVEKRPVVVEIDGHDEVRIQRRLTLTLSCDHRVIDGALGAKLLAEIVRGLSNPMLLVL